MGYDKIFNREIVDTKHSFQRLNFRDRFGDLVGTEELHNIFSDVLEKAIKVILNKYKDKRSSYGIHQKSTNAGIIIDWRPDKHSNSLVNCAVIQTYLQFRSYHTFYKDDIVIIVENILKDWSYLQSRITNEKIILQEGCVTRFKENDFGTIFWEGKFYDYFGMDNFILLD